MQMDNLELIYFDQLGNRPSQNDVTVVSNYQSIREISYHAEKERRYESSGASAPWTATPGAWQPGTATTTHNTQRLHDEPYDEVETSFTCQLLIDQEDHSTLCQHDSDQNYSTLCQHDSDQNHSTLCHHNSDQNHSTLCQQDSYQNHSTLCQHNSYQNHPTGCHHVSDDQDHSTSPQHPSGSCNSSSTELHEEDDIPELSMLSDDELPSEGNSGKSVDYGFIIAVTCLVTGISLVAISYAVPRDVEVNPDSVSAREMERLEREKARVGAHLDRCVIAGLCLLTLGGVLLSTLLMISMWKEEMIRRRVFAYSKHSAKLYGSINLRAGSSPTRETSSHLSIVDEDLEVLS